MEREEVLKNLGKYRILGTIGSGSMGTVYKGEDPEIRRVVAIKILRPSAFQQAMSSETARERFKTEARSAGNLRHPNIVTIFDAHSEEETPYIVMDYIDGQGLDTFLSRMGKLDPYDAMYYLSQIAQGLDYAHSRGVVHRDIKPSNILIDSTEHVYILDFGVASMIGSTAGSGPVMGSPGYMSPEQILNEPLDHRSDIFSLAVVAFELLTGHRPFPGDDFSSVVNNIVHGKRFELGAFCPDLPLQLEREFEKAFSRNREARFKNASLMIQVFCDSLAIRNPSAGSAKIRGYSYVRGGDKTSDVYRDLTNAPAVLPKKEGAAHQQSDAGPGVLSGFSKPAQRRNTVSNSTNAILGILALFLGVGAFWIFVVDPEPHAPIAAEAGPPPESTSSVTVGDKPGLPLEQPIEALTNEEILAIVRDMSDSDDRIVDAIREAKVRKLVNLNDVSDGPLNSDAYVIRVEILKAIGEFGDKELVPSVMLKLDDHDPAVRIAAAEALGKLADRRALGYLTARIATDDNEQVKDAAKKAVESINGFPYQEVRKIQ